jgi:hypothetical protein
MARLGRIMLMGRPYFVSERQSLGWSDDTGSPPGTM